MTPTSTPHTPRGLVLHLLEVLASHGASREFWTSYWHLAPWLRADEIDFVRRAAERPVLRPRLAQPHP